MIRDSGFGIRDAGYVISRIPRFASRFSHLASRNPHLVSCIAHLVSRYSYFKSNRLSLSAKLHSAAVDCQIQVQPAFPNKPPSGRIQIFQERPIQRIWFALGHRRMGHRDRDTAILDPVSPTGGVAVRLEMQQATRLQLQPETRWVSRPHIPVVIVAAARPFPLHADDSCGLSALCGSRRPGAEQRHREPGMGYSRHTTGPGFPYAVNAGSKRESSARKLLYWVLAECRRESLRRRLSQKGFRQADARPEPIETDLVGLVTDHCAIRRGRTALANWSHPREQVRNLRGKGRTSPLLKGCLR